MKAFVKLLQLAGILLSILALYILLLRFAYRESLFYWMLLTVVTLPVVFWTQKKRFKWWCLCAMLVAIALAASPIDFTIQRGSRLGIHLRPVEFGFASEPPAVNYGCVLQHNPPERAIVLSY
jgi:hypothetical protein